jgi:hypothetical protein
MNYFLSMIGKKQLNVKDKMKNKKIYKYCCCYICRLNKAWKAPDCACDDRPVYIKEVCENCPKNYFCDVYKNPNKYKF